MDIAKGNIFLSHRTRQLFNSLIFLLVLFNYSKIASAQSEDTTTSSIINQQIWIDFYPHYYLNEKLEYYGDAGYRTIVTKRNWTRIYARPSFKYHFNKTWEVHAGLGLFYIFYNLDTDQFEITPWQGVQLNWPNFKRINFKSQVKFEERWSFLTDTWNAEFEFRFRYKLSGKIHFVRVKKWSIPFYGEYFLPLHGKITELYQNKGRVGVGLGYKPVKDWEISFVFNWQGSRSGPDEQLNVSDYAYQLKIKKVWRRIILKPIKVE